MASRIQKKVFTRGTNKEILTGIVTLGSSGAISSQDCDGFVVTQTATETGRYTVALTDKYQAIEYLQGNLEISADTAAVQAKGVVVVSRGVDASAKVGYLQCTIVPTAAAAGADALPEDSAKLRILVVANTGNA